MLLSRREFFQVSLRQGAPAPRPPWAVAEIEFLRSCSACDLCVEQCPEEIISRGGGGFPQINFDRGACTFCRKCLEVCQDGALVAGDGQPWKIKASINSWCLAHKGVECRVCAEHCEIDAISLLLGGSAAIPIVNAEQCSGCGACVAPCPAHAIGMDVPENNPQRGAA